MIYLIQQKVYEQTVDLDTRGRIKGKEKYARILIRRKQAKSEDKQ